jgi:REP element-mobilizing transposase RayT
MTKEELNNLFSIEYNDLLKIVISLSDKFNYKLLSFNIDKNEDLKTEYQKNIPIESIDMLHDIFIRIHDYKKLSELYLDDFRSFFYRCCFNYLSSSTDKLKKNFGFNIDNIEVIDNEYDPLIDEKYNAVISYVNSTLKGIDLLIFNEHYINKLTYKQLSEKYNIGNIWVAKYTIKNIKLKIKKKLNGKEKRD